MKTVFVLLFALACLPSCQTSHSALDQSSAVNPFHRFRNLGDALRVYGNLQVSGTGVERKVTVRRNGNGSTEPLYVLDGFPIGTSYQRANHMINMQDVEQIKVLTSLSQLNQYGAQSNGGVILINTEANTQVSQQSSSSIPARVRPTRR